MSTIDPRDIDGTPLPRGDRPAMIGSDAVVGKRILAKVGNRYGNTNNVDEFRVLEMSPTGRWTRLMNVNGVKFWTATTEIGVVEVLTSLVDLLDPRPKG